MSHSKSFKGSVLALSTFAGVGLLAAASWSKTADISDLPTLLQVAGNLHPIFLHLPIGAFIYLALAEAWNLLDKAFFKRHQIRGALPVLLFGTTTAVLAAFVGLLLYLQGDYSGDLIELHLNWGIGFAISALIVLCCAVFFGEHSRFYRVVLLVTAALVSVAGHWGGLITHGDPLQPLIDARKTAVPAKAPEEILTYEVVDTIFVSKCYDCHAVNTKQKGGLLMDSYEALLLGGDDGEVLVPGDLERSRLSTYLHLPLEDDLHMPPEGKPQPSAREIEMIDQWIQAGASPDRRLLDEGLPAELQAWAIDYMQSTAVPEETGDEPATGVEAPALPADFQARIDRFEQVAENSITRTGPAGDQLVFSAVNARSHFDDRALDQLEPLAAYLVKADLSKTKVSADAVGQLVQHAPNLQRLNLAETGVGSQWIHSPEDLPQLESLVLFGTPLTPDAIPRLRQLTHLRALYLPRTGLDAASVEALREALPECQVVADDYLSIHAPKPVQPTEPTIKSSAEALTLPVPTAPNLAAGKAVTASSYYDIGKNVFPPDNLTDGRLADSGAPGDWSFWLAINGETGTATIDLGSAQEVNRIDLQNTRNRGFGDRGMQQFTLQSSLDGETFKTLLSGELPPVLVHSPESYDFHAYRVEPHSARYIRIVGESRYGASGGLNEVRVYHETEASQPLDEGTAPKQVHDHEHSESGHSHADATPASNQSHLTGSGDHQYQADPNWAKFEDGAPIGPTHGGVAISRSGDVYVSTDGPRAISVFDPQGYYLRSFQNQFGGIHSLTIRQEESREYLYGAHLRGQRILKFDLEGKIVLEIKHSEATPIPGTLKGLTAVTVGPDGRIYAAVGYGSNHMHIFSPEGKLLKTVGSRGKAGNQTKTNHGLALDTRFSPARLLVADRENRRLVHYDLEGEFIEVHAEGLRRPCAFSIRGELCAVAELQGRVTLLDKSGQVVAHLGDNPVKKQWAQFKVPLDALAANTFSAPHGLSFDQAGNLIVQDWNITGRLTLLTRIKKSDLQ
jgi:hypothetical protein